MLHCHGFLNGSWHDDSTNLGRIQSCPLQKKKEKTKKKITPKYSSTNWMDICHLEPSSWTPNILPPSPHLPVHSVLPARHQMADMLCAAAIASLLPNAPLPQLSLMACGGWCLWVMPQENAFHNLLFLLGKRERERERERGGRRGEGHGHNKQEKKTQREREREREGRKS